MIQKILTVLVLLSFYVYGNENIPKFNSLAEEAAYKKEQEKLNFENKQEGITKEEFIRKYEDYYNLLAKYYEKYAVKKTESLESIDGKYKKRNKLFQEKEQEIKILRMKFDELVDIEHNQAPSFTKDRIFMNRFEHNYKRKEVGEPYEIDSTWYIGDNRKRITLDFTTASYSFTYYENYLRDAYESYSFRQQEYKNIKERKKFSNSEYEEKKKIELKKQDQIIEERKKVKNVCEKWLKNAQKERYYVANAQNYIKKFRA